MSFKYTQWPTFVTGFYYTEGTALRLTYISFKKIKTDLARNSMYVSPVCKNETPLQSLKDSSWHFLWTSLLVDTTLPASQITNA